VSWADFGLAREGPGEWDARVDGRLRGTVCYMAQEYMTSGQPRGEQCHYVSSYVIMCVVL